MAVIAIVLMLAPALRFVMMRAPSGFIHQPAIDVRGGKRFCRSTRFTRPNLDAFLGEDGQGALANAAHNDDVRALLTQPAWVKSRFVRWRCHRSDAYNFSLLRVRLDERELLAAAKMSVEPAFG